MIGGGIVGVELAAEMVCHPSSRNKKISIVHSHSYLMERGNKRAANYAENFFRRNGVNLIFDERVTKIDGRSFITEKGTKIRADLAFLCTGIKPNFEFMEKNFSSSLNENKYIKVNNFLQLEGSKNIFVAGDITAIKEEKTAQNAEKQARVVIDNIRNLVSGKRLREYKSGDRVMVISLGKTNGILTYKNFIIPGIIPGLLKTLIEWKTMMRYKI